MRQGEDTWIVKSAPSEIECGHQISTRGKPNPSCVWGAAYIARLHCWRGDHFYYTGADPTYKNFEQFSFWPDRWEATRWIVYVGLLPDFEMFRPIGFAAWKILLVGLDEVSSGPCENYHGALWDIFGDSPFTQPTLKEIELGLQVADEQSRLALSGYDGRDIHVGRQIDMLRGCGLILSMRWAKYKGVLCLGRNPNCTFPTRPRSLTSFGSS